MPDELPRKANKIAVAGLTEFLQAAAQQTWPISEDQAEPTLTFRVALGQ